VKAEYLIDTDVLSEPLRPSPKPALITFLKTNQEAICTAAPVWHELWYGCSRLDRGIPIIPYDSKAADIHAKERARLERLGKTPPFVDGQIAAIALANDLVLVTKNARHYRTFKSLRVEPL
jgi:tRNA(fMet)-specific endonuclease VapC